MGLSSGEFLEGATFFTATAAGCLYVATGVRRRWLRDLTGSPGALAFTLAASAALVLATFLPAVTGRLTRTSVLVVALLFAVGGWALSRTPERRPRAGDAASYPPAPPSPAWSWVLAVTATGATAVLLVAHVWAQSIGPVVGVDALSFQTPAIARWIELQSLWDPVEFVPDTSNGTYPHTGNLVHLFAILPWSSTWAIRYVDVPFVVMAAIGVYALARELRAPTSSAVLAGIAVCSLPVLYESAITSAHVDPQMLAWFTAGSVFLVRWTRTRARHDLALALLGLGLALSTKWYSLLYVPAVIGVWAIAAGAGGRPWRTIVRQTVLLGGGVAALGSFWLVRNWIEAGTPFHPTPLRPFGVEIFDAPRNIVQERAGFSITDYLFDAAIWSDYFVPAFRRAYGAIAPALAGGLAVAAILGLSRRRRADGAGPVLAVAGASVVIAGLYAILPYSAFGLDGAPVLTYSNTRWLLPAFVGAAAVTAWLAGVSGRSRPAVEIALALAVLDGLRRTVHVGAQDVVVALLVLGGAAAGVVALRALRPRSALFGAVSLALVVVVLGGGWKLERRWADRPYGSFDAAIAWVESAAPSGHRVGIAGDWSLDGIVPILPAFGPRLGNSVAYVGPIIDGTLRRFTTRATFTTALQRGRYDVLILGRGNPPGPAGAQPYAGWARAAGFQARAASPRLLVMQRIPTGRAGT